MNQDLALLLVHGVMAVTVVEGLVLVAWHARTGRGPSAPAIVANLLAGLCLLLALRSVLAGPSWAGCAIWLAAAGIAHAIDLRRRWPPVCPLPSSTHQGPP